MPLSEDFFMKIRLMLEKEIKQMFYNQSVGVGNRFLGLNMKFESMEHYSMCLLLRKIIPD